MEVTLFGMLMLLRLLQSENANVKLRPKNICKQSVNSPQNVKSGVTIATAGGKLQHQLPVCLLMVPDDFKPVIGIDANLA